MNSNQPETNPSTSRQAARRQRWALIATLILSDALMVGLALLLAWYLRIGSGLLTYNAPSDFSFYRRMIWLSALIFLAIFYALDLYEYNLLLGGPQEYGLVVRGCTFGVMALVLVSFIQYDQPLSRGWLLMSWALCVLFVGLARFSWRRLFHRLRRRHGWLVAPALIVGVNEHAKALARQLIEQGSGLRILGFVDEFLPQGAQVVDGLSVLGTPNQLHQLCLQHEVEQIIFLPNAVAWETFQETIQAAGYENGYEIHISPGFYEILAANVQVTHKSFVPLLRVEQARITGIDRFLKLALDYSLGGLLALAAVPVVGVLSLAILLTDGRPVFTRHAVLGLGGKAFRTLKFRTSLLGAMDRHLDQNVPAAILENTQPGFRLGRFLYRTGLDKLPQLFDVLRGCMSLVGPRTSSIDPRRPQHNLHPSLLTVKPGWTGPWAVGGARTKEDEINLNLYYIRNWTIWLDLQILFQTFKLILTRQTRPTQ